MTISASSAPRGRPYFGALRLVLLALAILAIVGAAFAGGEVDYRFPQIIPTVIAPPFAVMMLFVIGLDILMTRIFMTDKAGPERARLRRVALVEVIALVVLIAAWLPFFQQLATR